jgi:small GTP-binding protein
LTIKIKSAQKREGQHSILETIIMEFLAKVVLCGNSGTGKTSIIKRISKEAFNENEKLTLGIDFIVRVFYASRHAVKLQIWDTAGQERFFCLVQNYFHGANVIVFVFDLCKRESFDAIENRWRPHAYWTQDKVTGVYHNERSESCVAYLVGNKSDRTDYREVGEGEAILYAHSRGMKYFETSALTGLHVEDEFQNIVDALDTSALHYERDKKMVVLDGKSYHKIENNEDLYDDEIKVEPTLDKRQSSKRCC